MLKILELCSGYGSQKIALNRLGFEVYSEISEIDEFAIQAYNQIHGRTKNWGDIRYIDENKLGDFDIIIYSTPCQDFSLAGKLAGGVKGSNTRSSLLWECERIIRKVKPKYLIMENVKNLVGKSFLPTFSNWLNILSDMGYTNYWQVLNAKDYGIPQNRERVFVVSVRDYQKFRFPSVEPLKCRLKDFLEDNVAEKYFLRDERVAGLIKSTELQKNKGNNFKFEPTLGNGIAKSITTKAGSRKTDNYILEPRIIQVGNIVNTGNWKNPQRGRIYSPMGICPTLNTCSGGGQEPKILLNYRVRKLTPHECWRLMGVHDSDYNKLKNLSDTQLYKLSGNSIVVDVLSKIFQSLLM